MKCPETGPCDGRRRLNAAKAICDGPQPELALHGAKRERAGVLKDPMPAIVLRPIGGVITDAVDQIDHADDAAKREGVRFDRNCCVFCGARVNHKRAAIRCAPRAILTVLAVVDDQIGPRLFDG